MDTISIIIKLINQNGISDAKYETTLGYTHISIESKIEAINKISGNNKVTVRLDFYYFSN